jgi:hypothetical protein
VSHRVYLPGSRGVGSGQSGGKLQQAHQGAAQQQKEKGAGGLARDAADYCSNCCCHLQFN